MTEDPARNLREFLQFWDEVLSGYGYCEDRLEAIGGELQDLMHDAELGEQKDRTGAAQFYRRMRAVRQERRALKNEAELLKPMVDWMLANNGVRNRLTQLLGGMNATTERQSQRQYRPRSAQTKEEK